MINGAISTRFTLKENIQFSSETVLPCFELIMFLIHSLKLKSFCRNFHRNTKACRKCYLYLFLELN